MYNLETSCIRADLLKNTTVKTKKKTPPKKHNIVMAFKTDKMLAISNLPGGCDFLIVLFDRALNQ
jgi:hypothetical protein